MLYFTDILPRYILFIFLCFSFPPKIPRPFFLKAYINITVIWFDVKRGRMSQNNRHNSIMLIYALFHWHSSPWDIIYFLCISFKHLWFCIKWVIHKYQFRSFLYHYICKLRINLISQYFPPSWEMPTLTKINMIELYSLVKPSRTNYNPAVY
jgi:hypothetical protein